MTRTEKQIIKLSKSVLKCNLKDEKSIFCSMALRLMDTQEYSCNYCKSINLVLELFPEVDREQLERELDKWV